MTPHLFAVAVCRCQAVGLQVPKFRRGLSIVEDLVRPAAPQEGLPLGAEPAGLYERKTQSPVIWLNLRKSEFPHQVPSWFNAAYGDEAQQTLGAYQSWLNAAGGDESQHSPGSRNT